MQTKFIQLTRLILGLVLGLTTMLGSLAKEAHDAHSIDVGGASSASGGARGKHQPAQQKAFRCEKLGIFGAITYTNTAGQYLGGIGGATIKVWKAGRFGSNDSGDLLATGITTDMAQNKGTFNLTVIPHQSEFDISFEKDGKVVFKSENLIADGCFYSNAFLVYKDGDMLPECHGLPTYQFVGSVKDGAGNLLQDTEVKAYITDAQGRRQIGSAKTASDGSYILNYCGQDGVNIELICSRLGYFDQKAVLPAAPKGTKDFVMVLDPAPCRHINGLKICGDKISQDPAGIITFEGNVNVNGVLHFGKPAGRLKYDSGKLSSDDCGGIFIDRVLLNSGGIPVTQDLFVYNDNHLEVRVDAQAIATLTQTVTNKWLTAAGFPLTMTKLTVLPDGIEVGGLFWPPAWLDIAKVISELQVETFRITRSGGINFDFKYVREAKGQLFSPRLMFEKLELQIKHLTKDDYTFFGKVKTNLGIVNPLFDGAKTSVEPVLGFGWEQGNRFRFDTLWVGLSTDYGWPIGATGFELYGGALGVGRNKATVDWISSIGGEIRIRPLGSKKAEAMFKAIAAPGEEFKFLDMKAALRYQWAPYRFFTGTVEADLAGKAELKGGISLVMEEDDLAKTRLWGTFDLPKKDPKIEREPIITGQANLVMTVEHDALGQENLINATGDITGTIQIPPYSIFTQGIPALARPLFPDGKPLKVATAALKYLNKEIWGTVSVANPISGAHLVDLTVRFIRGANDQLNLRIMDNVTGLSVVDQPIGIRQSSTAERQFVVSKNKPGLIVHVAGNQSAPDFKILLPNGQIAGANTIGEFQRMSFYKAEDLKESFYIIGLPDEGKYEILYDGNDIAWTKFYTFNTPPMLYVSDVQLTGNQLTVEWEDSDPDDNAKISIFVTDDGTSVGTPIVRGLMEDDLEDTFTFDVSQLRNGTYQVYAMIEDGHNAPLVVAATQSFTVVQPGTPNAPQNLQAEMKGDSLVLSWEKNNSPGTQYLINYSNEGSLDLPLHLSESIALNDTNQTTIYKAMKFGSSYKVAVRAFNSDLVSPPSNIVTVNYNSNRQNNAPRIETKHLSKRIIMAEVPFSWRLRAAEPDGDQVSITLDSDLNQRGERMSFYQDRDNQIIVEYTPTHQERGWHWFTLRIEDAHGATDSARYHFLVADANDLKPKMTFDSKYYSGMAQYVYLKIDSPLANQQESTRDEVQFTIRSSAKTAQLKAVETGPSTGMFVARISLQDLSTNPEDQLTATYWGGPDVEVIEANAILLDKPLPVTWVHFYGEYEKNAGVVLTWSTSSEQNNNYFEVERSLDGRVFDKIGEVAGNGTSSSIHRYSFLDTGNLREVQYYRIRQVDFDGGSERTRIIAVKRATAESLVVIWPNPVQEVLYMNAEELGGIKGGRVIDAHGGILATFNAANSIDVSDLPTGTYLLEIEGEQQLIKRRFVRK